MKKILFICTGNTCRSIMAEGFFNFAATQEPLLKDFIAFSAGIMAINDDPPSENSVEALKNGWGIDIGNHRAKLVKYDDIKNAHLILTMTRKHKDAIIRLFPDMKYKTYTLKEFPRIGSTREYFGKYITNDYNFTLDILDPYGMPLKIYEQSAKDIREAVNKVIEKLLQV